MPLLLRSNSSLGRIGKQGFGSGPNGRGDRDRELPFKNDFYNPQCGATQSIRIAGTCGYQAHGEAADDESSLSPRATAEPVGFLGMGSSSPTGR